MLLIVEDIQKPQGKPETGTVLLRFQVNFQGLGDASLIYGRDGLKEILRELVQQRLKIGKLNTSFRNHSERLFPPVSPDLADLREPPGGERPPDIKSKDIG